MLIHGLRPVDPHAPRRERAMPTECTAPNPHNVAYATFGAFLESHLAVSLLGSSADAQLMIAELRKARLFHYFGISAGKLTTQRLKDKQTLRTFVTRAYRGDPSGVAHWRRVASVLWRAFESVVQLQECCSRTERIKCTRAERRELYKKKERERLRKFRAANEPKLRGLARTVSG